MQLVYGVPQALIQEIAYFYNSDSCFTGMLLVGNNVLSLYTYDNISGELPSLFDWFKFGISIGQLSANMLVALAFCGF